MGWPAGQMLQILASLAAGYGLARAAAWRHRKRGR